MYPKLMLRGLLRHKKSGRRMIVLLALCSLAIMFCMAFRDSFARQYRQLGIDVSSGHLQILPADSPKNRQDSFGDHRQGLAFLRLDPGLRSFLAAMPEIELMMPAIETGATLFDMEGDATGYSAQLIGVDPELLPRILPAVKVKDGVAGLAWTGPPAEVPIYRPLPYPGETSPDSERFVRANFRPRDAAWEGWKQDAAARFPALFADAGAGAAKAADPGRFAGAAGDEAFLAALNRALDRDDLLAAAPVPAGGDYDYRVDDARAALELAEKSTAANDAQKHRRKVARKRWLQALMPEAIRPVWDMINIDTSYTMTVPPARDTDLLGQAAVVPVRMSAFVERMPLYFFNFYVDQKALRDYLGIGAEDCTSVFIRLKDGHDTARVKAAIEAGLKSRGLDHVVQDAETLGKIYLSTALAFDVITLIIIVLFVATVAVFVINSVTLALIKRRREIGTSIALGLSPFQNAVVMFGEMGFLVLGAWLGGAFIGTFLELAMARWGLPGMIFFPGERLYFLYSPWHALASLAIVLPIALAATAWALRKVGAMKAVDLLKEAS